MILFFYGQDNYRLKQKVKQLKEKFISASLGDTNLAILDGKTATLDEMVRQILAMPFLARTRLVIIENLISEGKKETQEKVAEFIKKIPSSTVLVFTETKPDKRVALFKRLLKADKSQEFKPLDEEQLRGWLKKEVENRQAKIEPEAISKLAEYVGPDLWRMSNELDKLIAYRIGCLKAHIAVQDIELLVQPQVEANIFAMVEAVAQKNIKLAIKELYKLLSSGEHELYILTMIIWQYRNLLIIKDLGDNPWALAKKANISPFVVQKCLALVQKYSLAELKVSYHTLLDFDIQIKTGKIEARVALEMLIFALAKKRVTET